MISASHLHKTGSAAKTMKRSIELYINGSRVDLDAEALILFNYRFEELSNPTIVKNSYSQNITLKSTDTNNRVFGAFFRSDRMIAGALFDPKRKVPFQIFDGGTLLEAGYAKLENVVTKNGVAHEYKVGLYGGLGSFFYALSYDENGNKRTLASLDFGREIGFTINASTVAQAWAALQTGPYTGASRWDIVNFAPCYNGIPTDDFDADKMIVKVDEVGLPATRQDGDDTYRAYENMSLVKLGRKVNEWEAHDLRSYLQRAVLRFRAVLQAIADPAQNGGFLVAVDSTFFNDDNPYFNDLWITLPQIHKLNGLSEGGSGVFSFPAGGGDIHLNSAVELGIPFGTEVTARVGVKITMGPAQDPAGDYLYGSAKDGTTVTSYCWLVQVVGYDSNGAAVAGSSVELLQSEIDGTRYGAQWVAQEIGYRPAFNAGYDVIGMAGQWNKTGAGMEWSKTFTAAMKAPNLSRLELVAVPVRIVDAATSGPVAIEANNTAYAYEDQEDATGSQTRVEWIGVEGVAGANEYEYDAATSVRSNSKITKDALLATEHTPAEYLLTFAKVFGLQFMIDREAKVVTIMTRDTFFADKADDIIDLTDRVDRSKDITVSPFLFDTKWLELAFEADDIQFAEEYLNAYGRKYGAARIDTGFEFNSETKELLEGIAATGGVEVLERSKMFNNLTEAGKPVPSAFLDAGDFTLYKNGVPGDDKTFPLPIPTAAASIDYWNDIYLGYDVYSKPQFHGADQKELDIRDTFLLFGGKVVRDAKYARLRLTDDDQYMAVLNDNTPCWHGGTFGVSFPVEDYPLFGRYSWAGSKIVRSLDFSMPAEIDIPGAGFEADAAIYERYWARFLSGRYDDDARVMKCSVDLSGLQVDAELLRRFFYYDGALWSLNAIENHSVTTFDPTRCEFVKVLDIEDYTNGQESGADVLTALPGAIVINPYGGTAVITVTASGPWTVAAVDLPGVTLSAYSGTGDAQVTVTAPENPGTALAGRLVFTLTSSGDTAVVQVAQAVPAGEGVYPSSLRFAAPGELWRGDAWQNYNWSDIIPRYVYGEYNIEVTVAEASITTWRVTSKPEWLSLYRDGESLGTGQQTGSAIVRAVAEPNYTQTENTGSIVFQFTHGNVVTTQTVEVMQQADKWAALQVWPDSMATVEVEDDTARVYGILNFIRFRLWANNESYVDFDIEDIHIAGRDFNYPEIVVTWNSTPLGDGADVRGSVELREYKISGEKEFKLDLVSIGTRPRTRYEASSSAAVLTWERFETLYLCPASGVVLPYLTLSQQDFTVAPDGTAAVDLFTNSAWALWQADLYDARLLVVADRTVPNAGNAWDYGNWPWSGSGNTPGIRLQPLVNFTGVLRDLRVTVFTLDADITGGNEIRGGIIQSILLHQDYMRWNVQQPAAQPAAGGSFVLTVDTNLTYFVNGYPWYLRNQSATASESWCHVSTDAEGRWITLTLDANTTGAQRSCSVTVHNADTNTDQTITIIQEA